MAGYKELNVWKKAKELAVEIYQVTQGKPFNLDFGLQGQIRRAAVSIPSNIAEGDERGSNRDSVRFLYIAKGSLAELQTQIEISYEIGYLDLKTLKELNNKCLSIGKMLGSLIKIRSSTNPLPITWFFTMKKKYILVTGGAGFIGTNFIRYALSEKPEWHIINLDALTYAGNPANFNDLANGQMDRYDIVHGDINDKACLDNLFKKYAFDAVFHFAAESHVDRSILGPKAFVDTNVGGTFNLLSTSHRFWEENGKPEAFRFMHVSTDEVYGSLGPTGYFTENTPYDPSSPYSASKAASDHFVKAFQRTYGFPVIVTNCSNNYGPYQFPEKLIPLMILNILENKSLPVYGDGLNVRDWLYVIDHCEALTACLEKGIPGETYNIGGNEEHKNINIVHMLCDIMDKKLDRSQNESSRNLIQFVKDRPGHDRRYAIDASKIKTEIGWTPRHNFEQAIDATINWYLNHVDWVNSIRSGDYLKWIEENYKNR